MAFLEVTDVRKGYGEGDAHIEVLRGISTSLVKGDFAALLGPSGSGKSTFLNIVGGLEPCDSGRVVVDGLDITSLSDREVGEYRRAELGFVFQFYNLVPDLTIRENIEVCAHLSTDSLPTGRPAALSWVMGSAKQVPSSGVGWPATALRHRPCAREEPEVAPVR